MEELRSILADHAHRYPLMQPQDAVKLLYQNEFGGGHLIPDRVVSLERLKREAEQTPFDPGAELMTEIGGGLVRLNLAARTEALYPLDALNRDFADSAERHRGTLPAFLEKLEQLRSLTAEGFFGFSSAALEGYLAEYVGQGCPPVSHSALYRESYRPAYRIVLRALAEASLAEYRKN